MAAIAPRPRGARSRSLDPFEAACGGPDVDDQLLVDVDVRDLRQVEPEEMARTVRGGLGVEVLDPRLVEDLDRAPGQLRLARPVVVGIEGGAVQGEARVALQVARLQRLPHRADPEVAVAPRRLRAGDARRAVLAKGRDRLVLVRVERGLHTLGQRGRGGGEVGPGSHERARCPSRRAPSSRMSKTINMPDRLRELIDLVLDSLDERADGAALAARANFSRDHLDRLLAAATGESPVALRRRLLLERAAWELRHGARPTEASRTAGYGSLAAFSRAFSRAFGSPPSSFAGEAALPAPNGIHFHPPAGIVVPGAPRDDLTARM